MISLSFDELLLFACGVETLWCSVYWDDLVSEALVLKGGVADRLAGSVVVC